jgi:hypothetical protein
MAAAIGCEIPQIYLPDIRRQHSERGIIRLVRFLFLGPISLFSLK